MALARLSACCVYLTTLFVAPLAFSLGAHRNSVGSGAVREAPFEGSIRGGTAIGFFGWSNRFSDRGSERSRP